MIMTEQDRERLFKEIQTALKEDFNINVSSKAIDLFFDNTVPENKYSLVHSYQLAKQHPYFSEIAEAQKSVDDFPGIVLSFSEYTSCIDVSTDKAANETMAWEWLIDSLETPKESSSPLFRRPEVFQVWETIYQNEHRSIKEAFNFIYQYELYEEIARKTNVKKYYGDFFIFNGYEQFDWINSIATNYLFEIQKIENMLKLDNKLNSHNGYSSKFKI